MFLGHFAAGLAAKNIAPRASLGVMFAAGEFLDLLWPVFLLAGWEHVRIAPGITRLTPFDFYDYPISHSLLMAFVWAACFGAAYLLWRRNRRAAIVLAALVASHWFLDLLVHRPDLPLFTGGAARFGLGAWNSVTITAVLELGLLAAGLALYLQQTRARDRIGSIGFGALIVVLVAIWVGSVFGPPPDNVTQLAISGIGIWLFVAWGWWVDRHRVSR
jgi:hypothetical protein